jgi:hypothetical protein
MPGLRPSLELSGSSEGDPEGGQGPGGVAGVATEAAARLTGPARLSAPIARLPRHAMTWGAVPVRSWEPSSAKITSRR